MKENNKIIFVNEDLELRRENTSDEECEIFEKNQDETAESHWKISIEKIKSESSEYFVPQPNFSFSQERKVRKGLVCLLRTMENVIPLFKFADNVEDGLMARTQHNFDKPRMRICFDPEHEIPKLQAWFAENNHPSRLQVEEYVATLNGLESRKGKKPLDINNVIYWFKNTRAAVKRAQMKNERHLLEPFYLQKLPQLYGGVDRLEYPTVCMSGARPGTDILGVSRTTIGITA